MQTKFAEIAAEQTWGMNAYNQVNEGWYFLIKARAEAWKISERYFYGFPLDNMKSKCKFIMA